MYRLATMHSVWASQADRQTGRRTDDSIVPITDRMQHARTIG